MTSDQLILKLQSDCQRLTDERDEYKKQLRETMNTLVLRESALEIKTEQCRAAETNLDEVSHELSFRTAWLAFVLFLAVVELAIILL